MTTSRDDVVIAAGRLFAKRGYHGTSMRDLGDELGLLRGSLYAHIGSKEELLVEVVRRGGELFGAVAERAQVSDVASAADRLELLVVGHLGVVLDHRDEARTFLHEARSLPDTQRQHVLEQRDRYEQEFRKVVRAGVADGSFRSDLDPHMAAIFVLSVLNAVERWYDPGGRIDRAGLAEQIQRFILDGLR